MSTVLPVLANMLSNGTGKSLKVAAVACGRHNEGFAINLNIFKDADKFRFILKRLACDSVVLYTVELGC
jgi:hypothetical protein